MSKEVGVNNKKKIDLTIIIGTLLVFIVCAIIGGISLNNYLTEINADYLPVKATIVRYETKEIRNSYFAYTLFYEYVAPDGTKYTGIAMDNISNVDYAEEAIGRIVTIYVSDKLHKQRDDLNIKPTTAIVFFVISGISLIISLVFLVQLRSSSKKKREKKEKPEQRYNKNANVKYR